MKFDQIYRRWCFGPGASSPSPTSCHGQPATTACPHQFKVGSKYTQDISENTSRALANQLLESQNYTTTDQGEQSFVVERLYLGLGTSCHFLWCPTRKNFIDVTSLTHISNVLNYKSWWFQPASKTSRDTFDHLFVDCLKLLTISETKKICYSPGFQRYECTNPN